MEELTKLLDADFTDAAIKLSTTEEGEALLGRGDQGSDERSWV